MYAKTVWLDHVTDKPGLYVIIDNKDGTWTITPAGKVMQQGTPQDQAHFNNIENGVWDIYAAATLIPAPGSLMLARSQPQPHRGALPPRKSRF